MHFVMHCPLMTQIYLYRQGYNYGHCNHSSCFGARRVRGLTCVYVIQGGHFFYMVLLCGFSHLRHDITNHPLMMHK